MYRLRMQLLCLQLEASCLQWSFFTYNRLWLFLLTVGAFLHTIGASLLIIEAFCASYCHKQLNGL